jgi:hypothetical protein
MTLKQRLSDPSTRILLAVLAYFLIFHLAFTGFRRDDLYNMKVLETFNGPGGALDYLVDRYLHWSSRTLADLLMVVFTGIPAIIWKLVDSFIAASCAFLMAAIAGTVYKTGWRSFIRPAAFVMVVLYPFFDMKTSGWVATTVNYLWPAAGLLYLGLAAARRVTGNDQEKNSTGLGAALIVVSALAAGSHELMALCGAALEGAVIVLLLMKRDRRIAVPAVLFAVEIFFVCWALFCPGNAIRNASTVPAQFPSWDAFSTVEHLTMALASTFDRLTSLGYYRGGVQSFMMQAALWILAWISVHRRFRSRGLDLLMASPLLLAYLMNQTDVRFWSIWALMDGMASEHMGQARMAYQPVMSLLLAAITTAGLFLAFLRPGPRGAIPGLCAAVCYLGGLGTRLAMGFSCTVYASNTRTYIALLFAMGVLIVMLWREAGMIGIFERAYGRGAEKEG